MRIKEFITICLLLVSVSLFAQEKTIEVTGVVTDTNKEPLVGVNVTVKDKPGLGAITDINGRYKINIEEFSRLVFSYIGFDTQEILVKRQNLVNVSMKESDAREIDEVVITGTGAQKKLTVTGAVTNVDVEVLKSNPSANLSNALAGNVSGVLAMQTSGQPGVNTSEFWIRGISTFGANSSALVLVDGFERDLDEINIEDIESFSVLKDASTTAIYGPRGANGVVLITTKHGKEGKIKINAKVETSYNARTITPEFADGYSYAMLMNEARITRNQERIYQEDEMEILRLGLDPDLYPNVDWMDVLLKDGAMTYRANLNMSGGGSTARYFVSLSYVNEEGMYKTDESMRKDYNTNPSSQRWNYRLNTDIDVTKTTLVKVGVSGSLKKRNAPGQGSNVWTSLMGQNPVSIPVMYSNGYIPAHGVEDNRKNPWVLATQTGYKEIWNNKIQTNISLEQKLDFITKGLRFEGRFGFDTNNQSEINRIRMPETWRAQRERDDDGNLIFKQQSAERPMEQTSSSTGERREFLEAYLQYNRAFKAHHVGGTLKYSQDAYRTTVDIGTDVKNGIAKRHMGLAGRASYNWNYRYFADFNFGYNGSENFAEGKRFGTFPAGSVGWIISEEKFMEPLKPYVSYLKLRASYGIVGNDIVSDGSRFLYLPDSYIISTAGGNNTTGIYSFGSTTNNFLPGAKESKVGNPDVTWETAAKQNYGVDLHFFDSHLKTSFDYFIEHRKDILISRQVNPGYLAISLPIVNMGKVDNKGFEVTARWEDAIRDFSYYIGTSWSYAKNKVIFKDEIPQPYEWMCETGRPVGQQFGYVNDGFFTEEDAANYESLKGKENGIPDHGSGFSPIAGDVKYKDLNKDGKIDANDISAIGYPTYPLLNGNMQLGFSWKGFDLSMTWAGAFQTSRLVSRIYRTPFGETGTNSLLQYMIDDAWTAEKGNSAKAPAISLSGSKTNNYKDSDLWLRDASYIRLKNIEVGYSFPKAMLQKFRISSLRLSLSGYNLLTFSDLDFCDPESNPDGRAYPLIKVVNFGLKIGF